MYFFYYRYRHEFRSDNLWREIKTVLDCFASPLTQLFEKNIQLVSQHAGNKDALKVLCGIQTVSVT